jgi:Tol biopolymer transport system component
MKGLLLAGSVLMLALVPGLASAAIDDTALVSRASGIAGEAANGDAGAYPAISGDGRFVAFVSGADNLSSADDDSVQNVFLRDTQTQTTTLISRATGPDGPGADADSFTPSLSSDGRYVAFASPAINLSDQDADLTRDIFVRDTLMDTTTLVSRADISVGGAAGVSDSFNPSISDSGNEIAFDSAADNLSLDDMDGTRDVFVRDVSAGTTSLVSRANGLDANPNAPGNGNSSRPSISANGQRIAFQSDADNLSADDNDAVRNIYVREPRFQFTQHVSRTTATGFVSDPADGDSFGAALSGDGSVVAFTSVARNLSGANAPSNATQVFKRRITEEETTLVSRAAGADGAPADRSSVRARVSADGRYIAFASNGDNLSDQDGPLTDVFVRDTVENRTALVSRATGASGAAGSGNSSSPSISGSGLLVVFCSDADNLSAEDNDSYVNLFERELAPGLPAPVIVPDLGSNDHSGHGGADGHSAADHAAAGHPADHSAGAGHSHAPAGNAKLSGGILFADKKQDIDKLFVFVTIHEHGKILLEGGIRLPGRASRTYSFRPVKRTLAPHLLRKMRLKLSGRSLRVVKRALRHRKLTARVKLTAVGDSGERQVARRTIRLKP